MTYATERYVIHMMEVYNEKYTEVLAFNSDNSPPVLDQLFTFSMHGAIDQG